MGLMWTKQFGGKHGSTLTQLDEEAHLFAWTKFGGHCTTTGSMQKMIFIVIYVPEHPVLTDLQVPVLSLTSTVLVAPHSGSPAAASAASARRLDMFA